MKKIEYYTSDGDVLKDKSKLDKLGAEGWDFVGYYQSVGLAVFKKVVDEFTTTKVDFVNKSDNLLTGKQLRMKTSDMCDVYNMFFLKYIGKEKTSNLLYGDGFKFKFLIENKTNNTLNIIAESIAVNGIVVAASCNIVTDMRPKKKSIGNISLFLERDNLKDCDIFNLNDIETVSFALSAINKDEEKLYGSTGEIVIDKE